MVPHQTIRHLASRLYESHPSVEMSRPSLPTPPSSCQAMQIALFFFGYRMCKLVADLTSHKRASSSRDVLGLRLP